MVHSAPFHLRNGQLPGPCKGSCKDDWSWPKKPLLPGSVNAQARHGVSVCYRKLMLQKTTVLFPSAALEVVEEASVLCPWGWCPLQLRSVRCWTARAPGAGQGCELDGAGGLLEGCSAPCVPRRHEEVKSVGLLIQSSSLSFCTGDIMTLSCKEGSM